MNRADCWRPQLGFNQAGHFLHPSKLKLLLGWRLFSPHAKLCLSALVLFSTELNSIQN